MDEGAKDASWVSFKNRLLNAVAKRDRKFVTSILHASVRSGQQGGRGIAEFRKQWELDSDASPLWQELGSALFLGSAWSKREKAPAELCSPYVAVKWPQDVDAYSGGAIVAKDALLKAAPSAESPTVATLAYNVVNVVGLGSQRPVPRRQAEMGEDQDRLRRGLRAGRAGQEPHRARRVLRPGRGWVAADRLRPGRREVARRGAEQVPASRVRPLRSTAAGMMAPIFSMSLQRPRADVFDW